MNGTLTFLLGGANSRKEHQQSTIIPLKADAKLLFFFELSNVLNDFFSFSAIAQYISILYVTIFLSTTTFVAPLFWPVSEVKSAFSDFRRCIGIHFAEDIAITTCVTIHWRKFRQIRHHRLRRWLHRAWEWSRPEWLWHTPIRAAGACSCSHCLVCRQSPRRSVPCRRG